MVERLDQSSVKYGMEISAQKTKLMTNSTKGISKEIKVSGEKLETVTQFKYLGSIISDKGSKPEIMSRIAQTTAALARLRPIWTAKNIPLKSKIRLMRALVMSVFLYACETWTLTADLQRRVSAMEMKSYRKILNISYKEHITNEEVRSKIYQAIGAHDDLLTTVKKRKLRWYGHVTRSSGLSKTILQGTVRGTRKVGRPGKKWNDNIEEWTGLKFQDSQTAAHDRNRWKQIVASSAVVPQRPSVMG